MMNPRRIPNPPTVRDHLTDDAVREYGVVPLVAAAAPLLGGIFSRKKKKKKPAPAKPASLVEGSDPLAKHFSNPTMWIVGGAAVVGIIALLSLTRAPAPSRR